MGGFKLNQVQIGPVSRSERANQLANQLLGEAPQYEVYGVLLRQLYEASRALDGALSRQSAPLLAGSDIGRMTHRLAVELQAIGRSTQTPANWMEATRAMVHRAETVMRDEPLLLLAHDFARASRDPAGIGACGQLSRLILDAPNDHLRAGYLPDPFEPFVMAIDQLDLPFLLRRRLREEGIRMQGLNLRLVREIHQAYIAG
jgi:hypothetical protein